MRKVITSLSFIVVISMVMIGVLGSSRSTVTGIPKSAGTIASSPHEIQDPLGTIDGAKNPELIPDAAAYALLFNFFAGRDEGEHLLVGGPPLLHAGIAGEPEAAVAAPKLASLQARRETVVTSVIEKLPQFVGPQGAAAVRSHIERVKSRIKIVPGPVMPSGMADMNH